MFLIFKRNNAYLAHQNSRDVYLLYTTLKIEKVVLKFVKKTSTYSRRHKFASCIKSLFISLYGNSAEKDLIFSKYFSPMTLYCIRAKNIHLENFDKLKSQF